MSYVNITIKGLSLCRPVAPTSQFPSGESQILILHPPDHNLKLTLERISSSYTDQFDVPVGVENKMAIRTVGTTGNLPVSTGQSGIPATGQWPDPKDYLVDIIYLHKRFSGTGSTIDLKPMTDTEMNISYLSIPTAAIFTTTQTSLEHELWLYRHQAGQPSQKTIISQSGRHKLWKDISFRFNIPASDAAAALNVNILKPFTRTYQRVHENGITHKITFDNDCHGDYCGNDFGYYYEILKGLDSQNYYVEIEEFPILKQITKTVQQTSEAACNAVIGDPGQDLETWYDGGHSLGKKGRSRVK